MNRLNTIYYRFQSEKKKYSINFNTTEISIGDIKKEIIRRRNLEKVPEKIELIFFNENNEEIKDDNVKINPLQLLCIKRIPSYKTFSNFVELIRDPSDISSSRFGDMNFLQHKTQRNITHSYDPIEKIIPKINFDNLKQKFSCSICNNVDEKLFIISCCGETICEKCKYRMELTHEHCKFCDEKPKLFMPNNPIGEFKERIINIIQKKKAKAEEEAEALKLSINTQMNIPTASNQPGIVVSKGNTIDERLNEKLKNLSTIEISGNGFTPQIGNPVLNQNIGHANQISSYGGIKGNINTFGINKKFFIIKDLKFLI